MLILLIISIIDFWFDIFKLLLLNKLNRNLIYIKTVLIILLLNISFLKYLNIYLQFIITLHMPTIIYAYLIW